VIDSAEASDKLGNNQAVNARNFLAELKRRDVFKVARRSAVRNARGQNTADNTASSAHVKVK
jgi:hypothetical protein